MSRRKRRTHKFVPEINLVPMLDMMSLLIQVLLINVHFGVYAQIETRAGGAQGKDPTEGLQLVVSIEEGGYRVNWSAGGMRPQRDLACPTQPCEPTGYDASALRDLLEKVKASSPDDTRIVLAPSGDVPFEVMVLTMDIVRADASGQKLFPDIVMADSK